MKGTTRANLGETVRPLYAKDRILNVVARKCNQEETGSETEKQNKDRKWATTLKSIPANLQAEVGLENAVRYRKDRLRIPPMDKEGGQTETQTDSSDSFVHMLVGLWSCMTNPG